MTIELKDKAAIERIADIAVNSSLVLGTKQRWSEILETFSKTIYDCGYSVEYGAGLTGIRNEDRIQGLSLKEYCEVALSNSRVCNYPNFDRVIKDLSDPGKLNSTIFEIKSAALCAIQKHTSNLDFFPSISRGSKTTHPEMQWETSFGMYIVEAKKQHSERRPVPTWLLEHAEIIENGLKSRNVVSYAYQRIEIVITHLVHEMEDVLLDQIASLVEKGIREKSGDTIETEYCSVTVLSCGCETKIPSDYPKLSYKSFSGEIAEKIDSIQNARLVIAAADPKRMLVAKNLLKDARKQISRTEKNIIFLDVLQPFEALSACKILLSKKRYNHVVGVVVHSIGWGYDSENSEMVKLFPSIGISVS